MQRTPARRINYVAKMRVSSWRSLYLASCAKQCKKHFGYNNNGVSRFRLYHRAVRVCVQFCLRFRTHFVASDRLKQSNIHACFAYVYFVDGENKRSLHICCICIKIFRSDCVCVRAIEECIGCSDWLPYAFGMSLQAKCACATLYNGTFILCILLSNNPEIPKASSWRRNATQPKRNTRTQQTRTTEKNRIACARTRACILNRKDTGWMVRTWAHA